MNKRLNRDFVYKGTDSETTKQGYDLLIKIGEKGIRRSHPSYVAHRGAKRLQKAIEGNFRAFFSKFDLVNALFFRYDTIRTDKEIENRLILKKIANNSLEAKEILRKIEESKSFRRGDGSIDFGSGFIKLWREPGSYTFRYGEYYHALGVTT